MTAAAAASGGGWCWDGRVLWQQRGRAWRLLGPFLPHDVGQGFLIPHHTQQLGRVTRATLAAAGASCGWAACCRWCRCCHSCACWSLACSLCAVLRPLEAGRQHARAVHDSSQVEASLQQRCMPRVWQDDPPGFWQQPRQPRTCRHSVHSRRAAPAAVCIREARTTQQWWGCYARLLELNAPRLGPPAALTFSQAGQHAVLGRGDEQHGCVDAAQRAVWQVASTQQVGPEVGCCCRAKHTRPARGESNGMSRHQRQESAARRDRCCSLGTAKALADR